MRYTFRRCRSSGHKPVPIQMESGYEQEFRKVGRISGWFRRRHRKKLLEAKKSWSHHEQFEAHWL